jgi:hypothetical protein
MFCFDIWFGEIPFYLRFLHLFAKAKYIDKIIVAAVWNNGEFKISLTRGASLLLRQEKKN